MVDRQYNPISRLKPSLVLAVLALTAALARAQPPGDANRSADSPRGSTSRTAGPRAPASRPRVRPPPARARSSSRTSATSRLAKASPSPAAISRLSRREFGAEEPYGSCKPLGNALEVRGYDGSSSSWLVFLLEIDAVGPLSFRWSDTLVREGKWQGTKVPITWDWQKLSNGVEVKFNKRDLQPGHMLTFSARDQLSSIIEKIDGRTIDPSPRGQPHGGRRRRAPRRLDRDPGRYRPGYQGKAERLLPGGLVSGAEGDHGQRRRGHLPGRRQRRGRRAGHQRRRHQHLQRPGLHGDHDPQLPHDRPHRHGRGRRGFPAVARRRQFLGLRAETLQRGEGMTGTERALIENVHASRMGGECFYAWGTARQSTGEQKQYQKSLTYLRCSVTDCAANAFNNNDMGENTSVLYCRVEDAGPGGWHAAEMPARFLRLVGNYVRNAGPFTVGDMSHRSDDLHRLGCGQAMVVDNVFEGIGKCGGIAVDHGSSQVVIANNLFINYNGPAINASSYTVRTSFPSNTVTITGNIIDMTYAGDKPAPRVGITVSASNTIVADNQVYVRGRPDPRVTGVVIAEPAVNVIVHDNLIRNCHQGLVTRRAQSRITEVIDATTFLEQGLPLEWKNSHLYRGWSLAWTSGAGRTPSP